MELEKDVIAYLQKLGPGLITGAADDDPSGIATYSQAGAQKGFGYLWVALFSLPFMVVAQEMCGRIGIVTDKGLAANIREHFPEWLLLFITGILFAANAFNIGADLGAMAEVTRLLAPALPFALLVIAFTLLSLYLMIFLTYKTYTRYLKWLSFILFTYIITAFSIRLPWKEILYSTFVPHIAFNNDSLLLISAVLGTTISPYLFFWQTSQEIEEKNLRSAIPEPASRDEIRNMRFDTWTGMSISNIVMFFIITVCAATLFSHGITNINTAADAAAALKPLAGNAAYFLFALGVIGAGLLAVPVLAGSSSYALSETLRWKLGLYRKMHEAYAFYGVIIVSVLIGLSLNFVGLDPIKALIYSAVANCLVAPIALIFVVSLSSSKKIMGEYANGWLTNVLGWLTILIMIVAGIATLVSLL